jgi:hypothetical protein
MGSGQEGSLGRAWKLHSVRLRVPSITASIAM